MTQLAAHTPGRYRALFCGRRWGKTDLAQTEMIEVAADLGQAVIYASTTLNRAIKTVWEETKLWAEKLGAESYEDVHEIHFPSGGVIYVLGFETKKLADRCRGIKKVGLAIVDECQDQDPEILKYAVVDCIRPGLADVKGRLLMCGTGGPPRGFWYDVVEGKINKFLAEFGVSFEVFRFTIWDNPWIKDPDQEVGEACALAGGVSRNDPYIRREWGSKEKGIEFTTDSERSPFPKLEMRELALPAGGRRFVGADVGSVDKSATTSYFIHPNLNHIALMVSGEQKTEGSSEQVAYIKGRIVEEQLQSSEQVHTAVDPGGGGKGVQMDLAKFENLEAIPAEKFNKGGFIRIMASDYKRGLLVIMPGNETVCAALESLEWEPGKEGSELRGHSPDIADSAIYGYRLARKFFEYKGELPTGPQPDPEIEAARERQEAQDEFLMETGLFG